MAAHHSDLDVSKTLYFDPVITWLMQIDFRWCYRNFSLTQSFWPHYGPGVNSASNRNEDQEYFLGGKGGQCVVLNLPPSCANCLEIWEPQPPGNVRTCTGLHKDCFTSHNMADSPRGFQWKVCTNETCLWCCCSSADGAVVYLVSVNALVEQHSQLSK